VKNGVCALGISERLAHKARIISLQAVMTKKRTPKTRDESQSKNTSPSTHVALSPKHPLMIVGTGASAGGFEAFKEQQNLLRIVLVPKLQLGNPVPTRASRIWLPSGSLEASESPVGSIPIKTTPCY
jgi:hypothetical protein